MGRSEGMKGSLILMFLITLGNVSIAQNKKSDTFYFSGDTSKIYKIKKIAGDTTKLIYFDTTGRLVESQTAYGNTKIGFNYIGLKRKYTSKWKVVCPKKNNSVYDHIDSIWDYDQTDKLTRFFTSNASRKRTLSRTSYYDSLGQLRFVTNMDSRKTCGTVEAIEYYQNRGLKNKKYYVFIWQDPFEYIAYNNDSISKEKMLAVNLINYEKLEEGKFLIPYGKWIHFDARGSVIKEKIYKRRKAKCP